MGPAVFWRTISCGRVKQILGESKLQIEAARARTRGKRRCYCGANVVCLDHPPLPNPNPKPMKTYLLLLVLILAFCVALVSARAQGTAFTYQGRLTDAGSAANGDYDLRFTIYDSATSGTVIAGPITNSPTSLNNGLFNVTLDFGASVFDGNPRWLEIGVRTNGIAGAFATLAPRQALTPTPYALFTPSATTASSLAASAVSAPQLNTPGAPTSGQVLSYNGTSLIWTNASTVAAAWSLNGNAGTTPGVNFLGTRDNQPLELWVNGQRALRLEPNAVAPNILAGHPSNYLATGLYGATISGGSMNTIETLAYLSTIGGGADNRIQTFSQWSTISGGESNTNGSYASGSTIGGGSFNHIQTGAQSATIGGVTFNTIQSNAFLSTLSGGYVNTIGTNSIGATHAGGPYIFDAPVTQIPPTASGQG